MVTGIITAAGLGTRSGLDGKFRKELLPLYDTINKKLVLRPVIDIVYRRLISAGCKKIIIVLDPADRISRLYVESNFENYEFALQPEKKGFGNAVYAGLSLVDGDDFILNAGDGMISDIAFYKSIGNSKHTTLNLFQTEHPERYGNAALDLEAGTVSAVIEKPQIPLSNFAIAALYFFKNDFKEYLNESTVELTDSINRYIKDGRRVDYNVIDRKQWLSIGKKEEYYKVLERSYEANLNHEMKNGKE